MIEEMDVLIDNGTWDLVYLPAGKKVIGCRWVFTMKRPNWKSLVARLKASLVAKSISKRKSLLFTPNWHLLYI